MFNSFVPKYRYAENGRTIINQNGYEVHNGAILHLAKDYIKKQNAASQNQQVRQRSASQQIENYSESINTLLDNAAKTLKTSTETPTAAVYAKNSRNIESNLNVLLAKTPQNKQTHTVYFCFTFEDAGLLKSLTSLGKTTTYRLILYKQNKQENQELEKQELEKQEYKIGYMDKEKKILGVKEKNDFDATKFVKDVMKPAMDVTRPGYFINATPGIKFRSTYLTLGNILNESIDGDKVNFKKLINNIAVKGRIYFVPIVPIGPIPIVPSIPTSNSGGYHKKYTRHHKKHTRRHRKNHTRKH